MVPSAAWAVPTGTPLGIPAGGRLVVVSEGVRMPAGPWSPVRVLGQRLRVRCPVLASSVRPCDVHASGVQCPVWASVVQCPASASAVSAPVCSWSASVRRAATRREDGEGRRSPHRVRARAAAGRAGQWRRRPGAGPSSWEVLRQRARFDRLANQGQAGCARGSPLGRGAGYASTFAYLRHGCVQVATGRIAGRADHDLAGPER